MLLASPPPSIGRCSVLSRSFLLGPDGPAGAPPGQALRSGSYMAARRSEDTARSTQSECPHFQGNPVAVPAGVHGHGLSPGHADCGTLYLRAGAGLVGCQLGINPPGWMEKLNCRDFVLPWRLT